MSVHRSPPSSLPAETPILVHFGSDSAINKTSIENAAECDFLNITHRNKRKCTESGIDQDQLSVFMSEMKSLFLDFKEEQNAKIEKIYESVEEIKRQNSTIQSSVTSLSDFYDSLKSQVEQLEAQLDTERTNNSQHLKTLEDKLERLERSARSSCVEIRNIPVTKSETKECLLNTIMKVGSVLNAPIQAHEVKDVYRIGKTDSNNRTIIVDFTSNLFKEKIVRMFKDFNKKNTKLSTEHLNISGPSKPVFVSENLTPKMKRLLFLAKDFASSNEYRFCWVTNGKIFLRKKEGAPHILISKELDLPKPDDPK